MAREGTDTEGAARLGIIQRDRLIAELQAEIFSSKLREAATPNEAFEETAKAHEPAVVVEHPDNGNDDEEALLAAVVSSQAREIDLLRSMLASLVAERGDDARTIDEFRRRVVESGGDSARAAIRRAYKMTLGAIRRRIMGAIGLRKP